MFLKTNGSASLGANMAVALITTFYGALLANLFALPIANKMKQFSKDELLLKTVLVEGLVAIQAGENPRVIEEKLKSFLTPALRRQVGVAKNVRFRGEEDFEDEEDEGF
jgi:chemotaxis protein MotA